MAVLVFAGLGRLFRRPVPVVQNVRKGALLTSLFLVLMFSYSALRNCLPFFYFHVFGMRLDHRYIALLMWCVLFAVGALLLLRTRKKLQHLTTVVTVLACVLVAMSLFNIISYQFSSDGGGSTAGQASSNTGNGAIIDNAEECRDIYYIILDAYAREDTLRDLYSYDNSEFLSELRKRGFYVADKSFSNYPHTILCFSTTLNMDYLPNVVKEIDPKSTNLNPMMQKMRYNKVWDFLKKRGYQTMAFSAGTEVTAMKSADIYLTSGWLSSEFHNVIVDMTPVWLFCQKLSRIPIYRQRVLNNFERMEQQAYRPVRADAPAAKRTPRFIFAHFLVPHEPFVFGPNGEPVDPPDLNVSPEPDYIEEGIRARFRKFHCDQTTYVGKRTLQAIDKIFAGYEPGHEPIIILQGDHGPALNMRGHGENPTDATFKERFRILNAYYMPGKGHKGLYPDITPVNSFRVILNNYFGTDYEMLEGRCYWSWWPTLYDLREVTDHVKSSTPEPVGTK